MATPHVSGLAALIWAANPSLTGTQVAARITSTAQDLGAAGWDSTYGYGLIDAGAAVAGGGSAASLCRAADRSTALAAAGQRGRGRLSPRHRAGADGGRSRQRGAGRPVRSGRPGRGGRQRLHPGPDAGDGARRARSSRRCACWPAQPGVQAVYLDATIHALWCRSREGPAAGEPAGPSVSFYRWVADPRRSACIDRSW